MKPAESQSFRLKGVKTCFSATAFPISGLNLSLSCVYTIRPRADTFVLYCSRVRLANILQQSYDYVTIIILYDNAKVMAYV